ncbi:MAG: glycine--tRNA ligase subunit beta, partial [Novosphingobium sp.]|uniref:glycine--tRNA ligase subunit beta n=1 Tax=Novosphingobium sp. TaxID=1874826 RepID=UPI003C798AE5
MGREISGVGAVSDFLLELRSEEIPARMQAGARADLEKLFRKEMAAAGVALGELTVWSTPRRLMLIARGLPAATAAVSEELKGPRVGAPPQALEGFLRKTGLSEDQLTERDGVLYAVTEKPGRATADVLAEAIPTIVRAFPWPKSQRWGAASLSSESLRWVRPLSAIVALFDGAVVDCEIGGVASGRMTRGHRFHSAGEISIDGVDDYAAKLRAGYVIVDHTERQDMIRAAAAKAAADAGLTLVEDEGLVIENAGLTEWPAPLLGRFDEAFLDVPPEVIQLTARTNQKYFVCTDAAGKLANAFVCTANIAASDGGAAIVDGNRKVLAARLSDARFFWEQDRKVPLAEQAKKLERITFHEKLGTVADKVERVAKLARWLVEQGIVKPPRNGEGDRREAVVEGSPPHHPSVTSPEGAAPPPRSGEVLELADQAELAARLCKADLVTEMVGEFPELQGLMGGYYARAEGLPDAVADAIRDHYKPVGQGDQVPTSPVTVAVSLADKMDTLLGFFCIGEQPTGSRDPFALRRAAIGFNATVIENRLNLDLM